MDNQFDEIEKTLTAAEKTITKPVKTNAQTNPPMSSVFTEFEKNYTGWKPKVKFISREERARKY